MKRKLGEEVVQKFSHRCPYCDRPVTYDDLRLKPGENKVKCPSCKKTYIKVAPSFTEGDHESRQQ
jgi:uncharacterized Zn-finger protein